MSGWPYTATTEPARRQSMIYRGPRQNICPVSRAGHKRKTSGQQPSSLPPQPPHGGWHPILISRQTASTWRRK